MTPTDPPTTTSAPSTTTTQAPTTTTTAPSTTTTQAPATTTTAPSTTTTQEPSTTTSESPTTTTQETESSSTDDAEPSIDSFTGALATDDGTAQHEDSLQVVVGSAVVLSWSASNAPDGVELSDSSSSDPQSFDASTSSATVTPRAEAQDYELVAIAGTVRSAAKRIHVSTHGADELVSAPALVTSPNAGKLSNPRWGPSGARHGKDAELLVDAADADGRTVYFLVESKEDDGEWTPLPQATGTVSDGKAVTHVLLDDSDEQPDGGDDDAAHTCSFRFHASFTAFANAGAAPDDGAKAADSDT